MSLFCGGFFFCVLAGTTTRWHPLSLSLTSWFLLVRLSVFSSFSCFSLHIFFKNHWCHLYTPYKPTPPYPKYPTPPHCNGCWLCPVVCVTKQDIRRTFVTSSLRDAFLKWRPFLKGRKELWVSWLWQTERTAITSCLGEEKADIWTYRLWIREDIFQCFKFSPGLNSSFHFFFTLVAWPTPARPQMSARCRMKGKGKDTEERERKYWVILCQSKKYTRILKGKKVSYRIHKTTRYIETRKLRPFTLILLRFIIENAS